MTNVTGKHIVVIGAARSGLAAALLLKRQQAEVFVSDFGSIPEHAKNQLKDAGIPFEEGGHSAEAKNAEFAVVSPGVPTEAPIVQHYLNSERKVFSEIECGSWFTTQPMVAVTGSNGKTTCTSWLSHIWKTASRAHNLAGNIGVAFSEKADTAEHEHILEVSSFQLDHIDTFRPTISIILNITADHMDRYNYSMDAYAAAKFRITENQTSGDYFIYNLDDNRVLNHAENLRNKKDAPTLWSFSTTREVDQGAFIKNNHIIFRLNRNYETLMPVHELGLQGQHNLQNGLAAALAARAAEIKNEAIRESLRTFKGVEHRLELVRTVDGVKYINDSKATNVNAVWFALDSYNVPITLILGGRDKGNEYAELEHQLREKVHTVIAIGESKDRIKAQLTSVVPHLLEADDMRDAVRTAKKQAKRGEVVLLSPACSSFDMFDDYEHRGRVFKQEVNKL